MAEYTVRTPGQLPTMLRALRKKSGLSQAEVALRYGVTQQSYSALERRADKMSADKLLSLLAILDTDLVLKPKGGPSPVLGVQLAEAQW